MIELLGTIFGFIFDVIGWALGFVFDVIGFVFGLLGSVLSFAFSLFWVLLIVGAILWFVRRSRREKAEPRTDAPVYEVADEDFVSFYEQQ